LFKLHVADIFSSLGGSGVGKNIFPISNTFDLSLKKYLTFFLLIPYTVFVLRRDEMRGKK